MPASVRWRLLASHPVADIPGTICEPYGLCLALDQEPHDVYIDERHLAQGEHDASHGLVLSDVPEARRVSVCMQLADRP